MHNIGNDIIDLKLAKTQSNWQRKGFLEKQFTQKETTSMDPLGPLGPDDFFGGVVFVGGM